MIKPTPAIVVIAYNRPKSLTRLLKSLEVAYYPKNNIELIISIDKQTNNQDVLTIANAFQWKFGNKTINYQKTHLGLRNHVLKCGNMTQEFGSAILLEDDIYVSPNFYFYTQEALLFSNGKEYIGGISLYNHQLNIHTKVSFSTIEDSHDNWYLQFASSWGQAWTSDQWKGFKEWYEITNELTESDDLPKNILSWSNYSWLKFYTAYLVKKNKFFLYPKISLSTNFNDVGTHAGKNITIYQVPLFRGKKTSYNFSTIETSKSVYDSFFENINLYKHLGLEKEFVCIDLHDYKPIRNERYYLTSKILNFKIVKSFKYSLRPLDENVIHNINGDDIFLYDTKIYKKNINKGQAIKKLEYNIKHIFYKDLILMVSTQTLLKLTKLFKR